MCVCYNEGPFKPKTGGGLKYIPNCWQIDSPTPKKYIKLWEINKEWQSRCSYTSYFIYIKVYVPWMM